MDNQVTLLLVEDDDVDVKAITRSIRSLKIANPFRVARDGVHGLEILRGENGEERLKPPYLILLDLNMPRMNGIEFLEAVRADPELKNSIIFVLTTSSDERDKLKAYDKNVAGYILKDTAGHSFMEAVGMIEHYWRVIEFP